MKKVVQYQTSEERESLLIENADLILVEEKNIVDGNYLVFSDVPLEKETVIVYSNVPKGKIEELEQRQDLTENALLELILGGM